MIHGPPPREVRFESVRATDDRTLSVGRTSGYAVAGAGTRCDRSRRDHAALHEHALAGGDLVSRDRRGAPGLDRPHGDSPRLDLDAAAPAHRSGSASAPTEVRRLHLVARSRRRLRAGRSGDPDRQSEGRRTVAATRRTQRTSTGWQESSALRADARVRTGRVRRGAARAVAASYGIARTVASLTRCTRAARDDAGDRSRLHATALLAEVRSTHAFAELSDREWQWALDFLTRGGDALQGYPQYRRVERARRCVSRDRSRDSRDCIACRSARSRAMPRCRSNG